MSESGQSASSYGFESSTAGSDRIGTAGPENEDGEGYSSFEGGVFGVLFTVSKEKNPSKAFVGFRLFMDWIQVFLLLVNPSYGWNIDQNSKWWQAFNFIQLNYFMSTRGYTFFLICMYILAVALAANLGLCVWVANSFKNNSFNHVWPIVWLRYFSLVFYQVLDVASLTLFLMTMDCQYFSVEKSDQGFNQEFPNVYCWTMPHLIHIIVAAAAIFIFFMLAIVFQMAEIELNPVSKNLMGMAHTKVEVWAFAIKMFMTCTSVFVTGVQWMSVFQLISSFMLCYLYLKWLPHLHETINHIRVGCYFSTFWAALLLTIMAYHPGYYVHDDAGRQKQANALSAALWALFIPMGFGGAALSWWRTRYFANVVVGKFRNAAPETKARKIYKFTDPREVEIASRCCRVWVDEDTLDKDAVLLAERIIKAGTILIPHQPYMAIWWSSFLIDVQGSYQSGYAELQDAKKMPNQSFLERFCIFIREQEHTQKASAATSGDNASIDLVSYVEFQRNYRLALQLHMDALVAKRTFWETLLHHTVTFNKMAQAVERIETTVKASERMYKQVLARHSNSVKIVSLYVKFLQGVRNDPWSAARWGAELEKMQRMEEEANERAVFGNGSIEHNVGGLQNDDSKGVVIMGANCLIRMINEPASHMFGYYNKNELVGKNVNIIIPPPFSRNHNNYVRNYIATGQTRILNQLRELVAMHRDRYVVPINMYITKVSGVGEDSVFMGIFSQVPVEPNTATLWCLNGGTVLSCDAEFTDWLGCKHEDVHGKPLSDLAVNKKEVEDFLTVIRGDVATRRHDDTIPAAGTKASKGDRANRNKSWTATNIQLKHVYLELIVTVEIKVMVGGIGDAAMYACRMTRLEDNTPTLLVTDAKGRINHVSSKLANKLGSSVSKLQAGGMLHAMDALLPPAFARIHHTWYRDRPDIIPPWSCRSSLSMCLNAMGAEGPCLMPFSMEFRRKEIPGREPVNAVLMTERTMDEALDERRLSLTLDSKGIVTATGNSPKSLFGFEPSAMMGKHLACILDVLKPAFRPTIPTQAQIQADEDMANKMLMHMAERSYEHPGMSWRVGVTGIMNPIALNNLGPMGLAMMTKKIVPAVMVVNPYLEQPELDGCDVILPAEMQIKIELWRADLMGGVLELDTQGNLVHPGIKGQSMYNANLVLGLPHSMVTGCNVSALIPLHGKPFLEALFCEGGLTAKPPVIHAGGRGNGNATGVRAPGRGGLRHGGQYARRRGSGPMQIVKIRHGTDFEDIELSIQAVVKQDIGVGCSLYILIHPVTPSMGRKDFRSWLWTSPPPTVAGVKAVSRRSSMVFDQRASLTRAIGASGRMPLAYPYPPNSTLPDIRDGKTDAFAEKLKAKLVGTMHDDMPLDNLEQDLIPVGEQEQQQDDSEKNDAVHTPPLRSSTRGEEDMVRITPPNLVPLEDNIESLGDDGSAPLASARRPSSRDSKSSKKASRPPSALPAKKNLPKKSDSKLSIASKASAAKAKKGSKAAVERKSSKVKDSDDESVGSGKATMKEGGRERISNWMSNSQYQEEEASSEDEETEAEAEQGQQQQADHDEDDRELEQLDEASSGMNDFKRGKRLKRLIKLLMGPQAQAPNFRLRWVSVVMVLILIVVDFAMFMTFLNMTQKQTEQINDLRSSALAINRVMMSTISTSAIGIILGGKSVTTLRHLGMEGQQEGLDYLKSAMESRVDELEMYHKGVFRGFGKLRQLPLAYGLRGIWEDPLLNMRIFFSSPNGTFAKNQNMSLWDGGNLLIKSLRNILQTFEMDYGLGTNNSANYVNSTDVLFVQYNAPRTILEAYQLTLDGLMQQAIQDSTKMNDVQLVILAVEGAFVGMISVVVIWIITSQVVFRRYAVFSVFMAVPAGILRGLATQAFNLEEGDAAEEDQQNNPEDAENGEGENTNNNLSMDRRGDVLGSGGSGKSGDPEEGKANFVLTTASVPPPTDVPKSFLARVADRLAIWRPPPILTATKRRLQPSWTAILWITWPFMFWAVFVVIINIIGYTQLVGMSRPIAISNIVQFVSIRVDRVLFFAQCLASEQYFDPTDSFTAAYVPRGAYNPLKEAYANRVSSDYGSLRLEYDAMLLGHKSAAVRAQPSAHYQLAVSGITFTQGARLMYNQVGCLAESSSDCQPLDSPFFRHVMYGLDPMLKELFFMVESLLEQPEIEQRMDSIFFKYIYEVGNADIRGGLNQLVDSYTKQVKGVYSSALALHIVALVMCTGLGLLFLVFIMLPNFHRATQESRRVAELLSALPPEMNVEMLVAQALAIKDQIGDNSNAGQDGAMRTKSLKDDESDDDSIAADGHNNTDYRIKAA